MSDLHEANAQDARLTAFLQSTEQHERDWIAFLEFEQAIQNAATNAAMFNMYDNDPGSDRELAALKLAVGGMFYRVLSRVDLGVILADAEGIGYAIRFGVINPTREALDHIANSDEFQALAQKGFDAERADSELRMAAIEARNREQEEEK